ncbi:hypothetical protein COO91_04786 [Nostoc flagelliforme CCNUN1]|uniref:Uncharacterized protein n=1 Tax=Nostoc flagelliforme CCNUN1 TaxID=2038116 RepID=A0A2K8STP4_9NOSO|nr:hypothetical protein COO91_04786 [Nostoc flagelliforme CCNUN1]
MILSHFPEIQKSNRKARVISHSFSVQCPMPHAQCPMPNTLFIHIPVSCNC